MNRFASSLLVAGCVATLLSAEALMAQEGSNPLDPLLPKSKVLVGPVVGINRNFHTGGFRTIDEPNCPVFGSGTGWGFLAGMTAEFQLGKSWSIIPRVMYESRPGSFSQELPEALVLIDPTAPPIKQTVSTSSEITYSLLNLEVMYKQEFAQVGKIRFGAAIGPAFAYVLGGKNNQVQDLIEPTNARFVNPTGLPANNNGRQLVFFNGDIPARNSTRFSVKGGLQAEVGLFGNAWIMTPGIYYDYGLTDVTNAENWNLSSAMFMIDFRRAF